MDVTPGSSFFQTVPGSAARPEAQPGHATGRLFEAQVVDGDQRAARPDRPDAPGRAPAAPYGPRGHLIDIIA